MESGLLNYICVGKALIECGINPVGIRLDSGDLSYLSKEVRKYFKLIDSSHGIDVFTNGKIIASNEINDDIMLELERNGHEIDIFGIGTNLATCKKSPALGVVYKVVMFDGDYKIKFSEDPDKSTLPCDKQVYRLYSSTGTVILDLMVEYGKNIQYEDDGSILCRHPTKPSLYAYVRPSKIEPLLLPVFENDQLSENELSVRTAKKVCVDSSMTIREDHLRHLNPTPMKVSLDKNLFTIVQETTIAKRQHKILS